MRSYKYIIWALTGVICAGLLHAGDTARFYSEGPRDKKEVALTFDDGPGPSTELILGVLKKYGVKATFFMEGSQVKARRQLVLKVFEAGHEIGSHTYSHMNFYKYAKDDKDAVLSGEIRKAEKVIYDATGVRPYLVRMPHGCVKPWVRKHAEEENIVLVNWSFGCDWVKMSSAEIADAYIKAIKPGAIFLMHDGGGTRKRTAEALPAIIEEIQNRGYKIVTVSELLNLPPQQTPTASKELPSAVKDVP